MPCGDGSDVSIDRDKRGLVQAHEHDTICDLATDTFERNQVCTDCIDILFPPRPQPLFDGSGRCSKCLSQAAQRRFDESCSITKAQLPKC